MIRRIHVTIKIVYFRALVMRAPIHVQLAAVIVVVIEQRQHRINCLAWFI
jgi:hypothetical protein